MSTVSEAHIRGSVSFDEQTDGTLSSKQSISGAETISSQITGEGNLQHDIGGSITYNAAARGILSNLARISGRGSLPSFTADKVHYDTTAGWNSQPNLIGQMGHIYIYSDYTTKEIEDEGETKTVDIPAIKIGDGLAYLIDTPYMITGDSQEFIDHINNRAIHVGTIDRINWDDKVSADVINNDTLVLFV